MTPNRPYTEGVAANAGGTHSMALSEQSTRTCVLFIGNSPENRVAVERAFTDAGFDVSTAYSYREALSVITQRRVALVICEQHLGDGTWLDLLSRFATMNEAPELVVILDVLDVSSWAEAMNLGAHDVLLCP